MNVLNAFMISLFDFFVVFVALVLISLCIKVLSLMIAYFEKRQKGKNTAAIPEVPVQKPANTEMEDKTVGEGELKLFGVDEKTAAMIMAIVSDESKIPLEELYFKSIKLLEN